MRLTHASIFSSKINFIASFKFFGNALCEHVICFADASVAVSAC
jgi:hypothetical protein